MRDHRKLKAFELADSLVMEIYKATQPFPKEELYGLSAQMRRAAVSVAANIVEGCAREGRKEYKFFLTISFGSLRELGYYLDLAKRLGYIAFEPYKELKKKHEQTARVLSGLIKAIDGLA
ncbi:MAG TPA: four helix bundle protein [bacterium]|nr:four helix bundle protein [bacterium]